MPINQGTVNRHVLPIHGQKLYERVGDQLTRAIPHRVRHQNYAHLRIRCIVADTWRVDPGQSPIDEPEYESKFES